MSSSEFFDVFIGSSGPQKHDYVRKVSTPSQCARLDIIRIACTIDLESRCLVCLLAAGRTVCLHDRHGNELVGEEPDQQQLWCDLSHQNRLRVMRYGAISSRRSGSGDEDRRSRSPMQGTTVSLAGPGNRDSPGEYRVLISPRCLCALPSARDRRVVFRVRRFQIKSLRVYRGMPKLRWSRRSKTTHRLPL